MPGTGKVERVPSALRHIRARARDLAHNNPHAARAVSILTSHTVGRGIRYAIRGDDDYAQQFRAWAASTRCDYDGQLDLYGLQAILIRTMFEAGEGLAIVRDVYDPATKKLYPQYQIVDPDLLDASASPHFGGGKVFSGVEIDARGHVKGYHIRPDGEAYKSQFIAAENVIHIYERVLPGQLRGIPRGTQALVRAHATDQFMTAALARARVEACMSVFIKTDRTDGTGGMIGEEIDEDGGERYEQMEPGLIAYLNAGEEISVVNPSSAGGLIDYIKVSLQSVAVSYSCTYSQISGDLAGHNFSSEKAGRIEFNRSIDSVREHYIMPGLRIFELRFRSAFAASENRDIDVDVSLTAPGRESIEPAKDALADMTAMAAGGMTFGQYCRSRGLDPDEQLNELIAERKKFEDAGITLKFGSFEVIASALKNISKDDDDDDSDKDEDPQDEPVA